MISQIRVSLLKSVSRKEQQEARALDVTIAAGFRFHDGVLLCADSELSTGAMKLYASKLIPCDLSGQGGGQFVFAICGSAPYARMAVDKCIGVIKTKKPKDRTGAGLRLAIEEAIETFHETHIFHHPLFHQGGGPDFQLLIAARSEVDKTLFLYTSNDAAVNEVEDYECVGAGSFLTHYLVGTMFHHKQMAMPDVANIAIHVLRETKGYVETCGGNSHFIALYRSGEISPIAHWDVSLKEDFSDIFKGAMNRLFVWAADLNATAEQLRKEFHLSYTVIQSYKESRKREEQRRREFYGELEPPSSKPSVSQKSEPEQ